MIPRSRKIVRRVTQRPAPAESPAITILEGGIALCSDPSGGDVRYKSRCGRFMNGYIYESALRLLGLTRRQNVLYRTWPGVLRGFTVIDRKHATLNLACYILTSGRDSRRRATKWLTVTDHLVSVCVCETSQQPITRHHGVTY